MVSIISINVDSIVHSGRRALLMDFIIRTNADIYLLQEIKTDSTIKLKIPGYNVIRGDVRRGSGGTAILIRDTIPITEPIIYNDDIQATSIKL